MSELIAIQSIDYLAVGHISQDLNAEGVQLGGTAAYAALTARAMGLRAGILTSCAADTSLDSLVGIQTISQPAENSTTFENIQTAAGRTQILLHRAAKLDFAHLPDMWKRTSIIHLAPVADEVDAQLPAGISSALLGLTPQGWMRQWDAEGRVTPKKWCEAEASLNHAGAAIISLEDVAEDEEIIEEMSLASRVLVVTEGAEGARLYWNGDLRRFHAPKMNVVDSTGAGDIFAAAFFIRLHTTRDPWEAARFATQLAAYSVTRRGLDSIPTQEEIQTCQMEVL